MWLGDDNYAPWVAPHKHMPEDRNTAQLLAVQLPSLTPARTGPHKVGVHRTAAGGDPDLVGTTDRLDANGLSLREVHEALGRYVWLDLDLGGPEPVRALGEVLPNRDSTQVALDIRFKHLFPDQRRRLLDALERP